MMLCCHFDNVFILCSLNNIWMMSEWGLHDFLDYVWNDIWTLCGCCSAVFWFHLAAVVTFLLSYWYLNDVLLMFERCLNVVLLVILIVLSWFFLSKWCMDDVCAISESCLNDACMMYWSHFDAVFICFVLITFAWCLNDVWMMFAWRLKWYLNHVWMRSCCHFAVVFTFCLSK